MVGLSRRSLWRVRIASGAVFFWHIVYILANLGIIYNIILLYQTINVKKQISFLFFIAWDKYADNDCVQGF